MGNDFVNDPDFRDIDAVKNICEIFGKTNERFRLEHLTLRCLFETDKGLRKENILQLQEIFDEKGLRLRRVTVIDFQVLAYTKNRDTSERYFYVCNIPKDDIRLPYKNLIIN
jgi:hypothetical protein